MTACAELEGALAERASGPLDPADEAVVAAHLAGCPSCRELFAAYALTLDLVRLPPEAPPGTVPLSAHRRRRSADGATLAERTLASWKASERRRLGGRVLAGGLAVAAALVLVAISPLLPSSRPSPAGAPVASPATAGWVVGAAVTAGGVDELLRPGDLELAELAPADELEEDLLVLASYDAAALP